MTSPVSLSPRALMSLLVNGTKAVDVIQTALEVGLLDVLEPGPVSYEKSADASAWFRAASTSFSTAWRA